MVYRAIVIHAISAKQMPLTHWKEDVVSAEAADTRLPLGSFLRRPDVNMRRSAFIEATTVSLACSGNAYWLKALDAFGRIRNVTLLNPNDMRVVREDGILKFYYRGQINGRYRETPFLENEIQHLKLLRVPGTEYGLGPIQAARIEIEGTLDLRDYSANWFREGTVPTGVLTSDQILSPDQAVQAKESWKASQGGKHDVAVLGQGLTYAAVFMNPKDAQFLENMQFSVTQIARLFGAPSSLMLATVEGNTQTYQNVEQDWIGFVRFSNMQYLIEIEDAFADLLPRFEYAKFDVDALFRSDTQTRYTAYKVGIEAGFLLRSEVRKKENLKPIPGIDDKPEPVAPVAPADPAQEDQDANV